MAKLRRLIKETTGFEMARVTEDGELTSNLDGQYMTADPDTNPLYSNDAKTTNYLYKDA